MTKTIAVFTVLLVLVLFAASGMCADTTYKIERITKTSLLSDIGQGTAATHPNYIFYLSVDGSNIIRSVHLGGSEAVLIAKHFKVQTVGDLIGRKFISDRTEPSYALQNLVLLEKHGGTYFPPSFDELYERAAVALARMECPDFSEEDPDVVADAFSAVFSGWHVHTGWLDSFSGRVFKLSGGHVALVPIRVENFSTRMPGPAAYLLLTGEKRSQKFILGPYETPIVFAD